MRAAQLFRDDATKIDEFQQLVSRFNRGVILATGLVDSIASLSGLGHDDAAPPEAGSLIKELAELFDESHKRDALVAAWNDRRARTEVEDYPTLPPGAAAPAGGAAGWHGGARVLRLKSATAPSSRAPVARQGAWGSAAAGGSGSAGKPSTTTSVIGSSSPWLPGPITITRTVPVSARATAASAAGKKTTAAAIGGGRGTPSRGEMADTAAFPALPAAQAPAAIGFSSFTPGATGGRVVRRDLGRATGNVWDASSAGGSAKGSAASEEGEGEAGAGGKGKKSGRKKQTLMHFG
jgi:hypothetical protein